MSGSSSRRCSRAGCRWRGSRRRWWASAWFSARSRWSRAAGSSRSAATAFARSRSRRSTPGGSVPCRRGAVPADNDLAVTFDSRGPDGGCAGYSCGSGSMAARNCWSAARPGASASRARGGCSASTSPRAAMFRRRRAIRKSSTSASWPSGKSLQLRDATWQRGWDQKELTLPELAEARLGPRDCRDAPSRPNLWPARAGRDRPAGAAAGPAAGVRHQEARPLARRAAVRRFAGSAPSRQLRQEPRRAGRGQPPLMFPARWRAGAAGRAAVHVLAHAAQPQPVHSLLDRSPPPARLEPRTARASRAARAWPGLLCHLAARQMDSAVAAHRGAFCR